jgi:hypothetical protein
MGKLARSGKTEIRQAGVGKSNVALWVRIATHRERSFDPRAVPLIVPVTHLLTFGGDEQDSTEAGRGDWVPPCRTRIERETPRQL